MIVVKKIDVFLDILKKDMGAEATLFALNETGFVRVATTLKTESGRSMEGSLLDPKGAVSEQLLQGETFFGAGDFLGELYIAKAVLLKILMGELLGRLLLVIQFAN